MNVNKKIRKLFRWGIFKLKSMEVRKAERPTQAFDFAASENYALCIPCTFDIQ